MIQAQSLNHLIQLADNPPSQYNHEKWTDQESLTLYFARVPGSRDFFLTTLKPLDKIVRAGDVEGCLYFVHLNTVRDAEILREAEQGVGTESLHASPSSTGVSGQPSEVRRRPVLSPDQLSQPRDVRPSINLTKASSQPTLAVRRKPIGKENVGTMNALPRGRLIGPRPLHGSEVNLKERDLNTSPSKKSAQWTGTEGHQYSQDVPPDPYAVKQRQLDELYESNADFDNRFAGHRKSLESPWPATSITLIRRYDGMQSNVGHVSAGGKIEMQSEGYSKSQHPRERSLDGKCDDLFSTSLEQSDPLYGHSQPSNRLSSSDAHFVGSRKQANRRTQFLTPWKTACHFAASIGGRSLQCFHEKPDNAQPAIVSELRFNLPSSQALRAKPKQADENADSSKRASWMHLHHRSKSESTVSLELDEERLDLSLGKELAGGGFSGQKAKLGKLIIHREGFAFLDLLVIANIAMWLKIYDKTSQIDF